MKTQICDFKLKSTKLQLINLIDSLKQKHQIHSLKLTSNRAHMSFISYLYSENHHNSN